MRTRGREATDGSTHRFSFAPFNPRIRPCKAEQRREAGQAVADFIAQGGNIKGR